MPQDHLPPPPNKQTKKSNTHTTNFPHMCPVTWIRVVCQYTFTFLALSDNKAPRYTVQSQRFSSSYGACQAHKHYAMASTLPATLTSGPRSVAKVRKFRRWEIHTHSFEDPNLVWPCSSNSKPTLHKLLEAFLRHAQPGCKRLCSSDYTDFRIHSTICF